MKKKLKNKRGVSILEMLIAVLLLSLLTVGGVAATTVVMADYKRMGEVANAEILASTVAEAISNEIRLGRNIVDRAADETVLTLDSVFFGEKAELKLDAGRLVAIVNGDTTNPKQVLSEDTYDGLQLRDLKFEKVPASTGTTGKTTYEISFTVYSGISGELWKHSVSAAQMLE